MTKKNILFSEDFHGVWESLIFDSDVKAQVRKHFNFLNLCCFWYWDHDCDIFFSFFSFTADKLCNDNITLLRQAWNNPYFYVFYTLGQKLLFNSEIIVTWYAPLNNFTMKD